jgi:hypothetical protein
VPLTAEMGRSAVRHEHDLLRRGFTVSQVVHHWAFEVFRKGDVGVTGSTGTVLHRSLLGLRALIARSLVEARLTQSVQNPEPIQVSRD